MPKAEIVKRSVEQIGGDIKKAAWSSIVESFALIILGIFLIIWPDTVIKVLAYIVGVFFIVKGGFRIVNYFLNKGQQNFFDNGLLIGVVSILIGIVSLVMGEEVASVFRVIVGVIIIYESLVRINTATKLATAKIDGWQFILTLSLVMLALGIFVTFNTGAVVALIGGLLIVTGIIGLIGDIVFVQHVNTVVDRLTKKV